MRPKGILILFLFLLPLLAATWPQGEKTPVAILRFDNNTGDERYEHLGRALSSMLISDLSVVEEIQLVERERMEDLLNELQLQQSGYVDPETAVTVGMIVGAQYVVTGAFLTVDPDMRLDTRIARVETSEIVSTAEVTGEKDNFFELEQRLADQLVEGMQLVLTEDQRDRMRARQEANRIDLETAVAFSRALCYMDYGAYVEAFEEIQGVRQTAPGSEIVNLTFQHLKERVEEEAKDRLKDRANQALSGLLGRDRPNRRTQTVSLLPDC